MNCIIIEDEPLALKRIEGYLKKISYLNLINTFTNGLDAIKFLKNSQIDLIFLDIEMDDLTGIELLKSVTDLPEIIVTTAYEKYALEGYELNVTDYLLKPFSFERFVQSVEKVYSRLSREHHFDKNYIFVKTEYRMEKISFSDILYIEGMGDYRNVQTTSKKILTLQTFGALEKYLPKDKFCRVHKSYLVSIEKIEFVERNRIKINEKRIPISETYAHIFFELIGISKRK